MKKFLENCRKFLCNTVLVFSDTVYLDKKNLNTYLVCMTFDKLLVFNKPIYENTNQVRFQKGIWIDETIKICLGILGSHDYKIYVSEDKIYPANDEDARTKKLFETFLENCKKKEGWVSWVSKSIKEGQGFMTSTDLFLRIQDEKNNISLVRSMREKACLEGKWDSKKQEYQVGNVILKFQKGLERKILPSFVDQCVLDCIIFKDSIKVWYYDYKSGKLIKVTACLHKHELYTLVVDSSRTRFPKIEFKNISSKVCKSDAVIFPNKIVLRKGFIEIRDPEIEEATKYEQIKASFEEYFKKCKEYQCSNNGMIELHIVSKSDKNYKKGCLNLKENKLLRRNDNFYESGEMLESTTETKYEDITLNVCLNSMYNKEMRIIENEHDYYKLITKENYKSEEQYPLNIFFEMNCEKKNLKLLANSF